MQRWYNSCCSLSEQGGFFLLIVRKILEVGENRYLCRGAGEIQNGTYSLEGLKSWCDFLNQDTEYWWKSLSTTKWFWREYGMLIIT